MEWSRKPQHELDNQKLMSSWLKLSLAWHSSAAAFFPFFFGSFKKYSNVLYLRWKSISTRAANSIFCLVPEVFPNQFVLWCVESFISKWFDTKAEIELFYALCFFCSSLEPAFLFCTLLCSKWWLVLEKAAEKHLMSYCFHYNYKNGNSKLGLSCAKSY